MTDQRIFSYLSILKFFYENPFEQEFSGVSKKDALYLVQSHLRDLSARYPEDHEFKDLKNISLLSNIDFATKIGKDFRFAFDNFNKTLERAIRALDDEQQLIDSQAKQGRPTPARLPPNIPPNISALVEEYERNVLQTVSRHPSPRGQWFSGVSNRHLLRRAWEDEVALQDKDGNAISKKDALSRLLETARFAEIKKQQEENLISKKELLLENAESAFERAFAETGAAAVISPKDIKNLFIDILEKDSEEEQEVWQGQVLSVFSGMGITPKILSKEERDKKIKSAYQKKVQEQIYQRLSGGAPPTPDEQLKKQRETTAQTQAADLAREIVDNLNTKALIFASLRKHLNNIYAISDIDQKREILGGLLFGRVLAEANSACAEIQDVRKNRLIEEATFDAVGELLSARYVDRLTPEFVRSTIEKHLQKKVGKKIKLPDGSFPEIKLDQEADFASEIIEITSDAVPQSIEQALDQTAGQYGGKYKIPIPGLIFLDQLARTSIVANNALYESLKKAQNLREGWDLFKKSDYIKDHLQRNIIYFKELLDKETDPQKKERLQQNVDFFNACLADPTKTPDDVIFQVFSLQYAEEHHLSIEERQLFMKYLENYQRVIQKSPILGRWVHFVANFNSLETTNWVSKTFQKIPILKNFMQLPNAQVWALSKIFFQVAINDPSVVPLAVWQLGWGITKSSFLFSVKQKFASRVNMFFERLIEKTPSLFAKNTLRGVRSLVFVRHRGVTIITLLQPLAAVEAIWDKAWRTGAQLLVDKTVIWALRLLGKRVFASLVSSIGVGGVLFGIPVIGPVLGFLWIIIPFVWDFLIPERVKRFLKWVVMGLSLGLLWLIYYVLGLGGVLGLIIGAFIPVVGPVLGALIGMGVGIGVYVLTGSKLLAPGWFVNLFPNLSGIFGGSAGSVASGIGQSLGSLGAGTAYAAPATGGAIAVGTVAGAGVASYLGITFLTTALWTPVSPSAVPGGAVATSFQVRKSVKEVNTGFCTFSDTKSSCTNDAADPGKNTEFEYQIKIQVTDKNKKLTNFKITDEIHIIALGPNPPANPTMKDVKKYVVTPTNIVPPTELPDASGNNTAVVTYIINFRDSKYMNSYISNLVTVETGGEKATNGFSFTIGKPPPSMCPLLLGEITCGSWGGTYDCHGTKSYWQYVETYDGRPACSYPIPVLDNSMSQKTQSSWPCYSPSGSETYGFALDISKTVDPSGSVFFPWIVGEDEISWTMENSFPNGTYFAAFYRGVAPSGKQFRIYVTHMNSSFAPNGESGEKLGEICLSTNYDEYDNKTSACYMSTPHLHIELAIDGKAVRPEEYLLCGFDTY